MSTKINEYCIRCGACRAPCPNEAISRSDPTFVIDPQLCTECVGFAESQACADVCPVDGCEPDPERVESEEVLIERARKLHPDVDFGENYKSRFRK